MYVCGITAYDESHLGHARAAVVFDVIYRYLSQRGFKVDYVRNFTDVDDKIIKKSAETGLSCEAVSEKYIRAYTEVMNQLGIKPPQKEPRATQHIPEMLHLISDLERKGFAYRAGNDVVFSIRKFASYGKLSHKKIDELEAGARVEVDQKKQDPLDFVLWKGSKPGEPKWLSPWGEGRPGWHIECSAMSMRYLGESFDIHGGGRDLIFPHHENEIAQSEASTGKILARYWIHNGFVNIEEEKMSKSLGNIRTVASMLQRWSSEAIRLFLLSSHYRSPLNFTEKNLDAAEESVSRFYETLHRLNSLESGTSTLPDMNLYPALEKAMDDDFNTAAFLGVLFDRLRRLNSWMDKKKEINPGSQNILREEIGRIFEVLGIFGQRPEEFLGSQKASRLGQVNLQPEEIERLILGRQQARNSKNWQKADQIRKELAAHGIELKDNPDGTTSWGIKSPGQ